MNRPSSPQQFEGAPYASDRRRPLSELPIAGIGAGPIGLAAAAHLLARRGWTPPPADGFPAGRELAAHYLDPLAGHPEVAPRLRLGMRVTGIARSLIGKVKSAAWLAGDEEGARRVELRLPETGVCSGLFVEEAKASIASSCCVPSCCGAAA